VNNSETVLDAAQFTTEH